MPISCRSPMFHIRWILFKNLIDMFENSCRRKWYANILPVFCISFLQEQEYVFLGLCETSVMPHFVWFSRFGLYIYEFSFSYSSDSESFLGNPTQIGREIIESSNIKYSIILWKFGDKAGSWAYLISFPYYPKHCET